MLRHPALEAFSRDHNVGLLLARRLQDAVLGPAEARTAIELFREAWFGELLDHFAEEERLLLPLASVNHAERLIREHFVIAAAAAALEDPGLKARVLGEAGAVLEAHVRWEERELFPAIEASATPEQLRMLQEQTDIMEERHWDSPLAGRRRELVQKRRILREGRG